jgi:hypothetical protein
MDKLALTPSAGLTMGLGLVLMIGTGLLFLGIAYLIRSKLPERKPRGATSCTPSR